MLDSFAELILSVINKPSLRRTAAFFSLILIAIAVLVVYEKYTASLRLNRLEKEITILERLQTLHSQSTNVNAELERTWVRLSAHAQQTIEEDRMSIAFVPSNLSFSMESFLKFIAGSSIWWFAVLVEIAKFRKKPNWNDFTGSVIVAFLVGLVATAVPPIWWPWFHILVYPWLIAVAVLAAFIPLLIPALIRAKATAQKNQCINNLRQIDGATRAWTLENDRTDDAVPTRDDLKSYLNGSFPNCPSGGRYSIGSVADGPKCSETHHSRVEVKSESRRFF